MKRKLNLKVCTLLWLWLLLPGWYCFGQKGTNINDPVAGELLDKVAKKYQASALDIDFTITTIRPKLKPEEPESKYTSADNGRLLMKGKKFKIILNGHEIVCDGMNIWSFATEAKEVQLNEYDESDEVFSPSKIFNLHKEGFSYQIKEKKVFQGKNVTVIELSPSNRKLSFFKIDVAVEDGSNAIMESKIYEKSGTRYIYKMNKVAAVNATDADFTFDMKSHPGVKLVDLR